MKTVNFNYPYSSQPTTSSADFKTLSAPVSNWFSRWGQTFKQWLVESSEIQITQMTGRDGQNWWRVYDPSTQKLQWMTNEEEVLRWLDTARHR